MIKLLVIPRFPFKESENECGYYDVILPQARITIMRMWCTTWRWVVWDLAEKSIKNIFDEFFGEHNWEIEFLGKSDWLPIELNFKLKSMNQQNDQISIFELSNKRRQYSLPPWSKEEDRFKEIETRGWR